jgi:hypothetical protein
VEQVRLYLDGVAKSLIDRLYGPQGPAWGTKLSELEDVVVAVRQALSEKMLAQALERQAAATDQLPQAVRLCPDCHRPGTSEGPEARLVLTRGGEAAWLEPHLHCTRCRRDFFPSIQEPGP